jgi:glycerate dehydrogenase
MKIVVLDGWTLNPGDNPWDEVATLGDLTVYDRTDPEDIVARTAGAEIVLTNKTPLQEDTLTRMPNLRLIAVLATGYNVVDVAAAGLLGIPVVNVPEYGTASVAQHAIALLLELSNRVGLHGDAVRHGEWLQSHDFCFSKSPLTELAGKSFGVVGFGRIGRQTARIANALGMKILAYNHRPKDASPDLPVTWVDLQELFARADVVSLHCPLTRDNGGFVNARLLSSMKRTAFLLNTARGALVNEWDLAGALFAGKIAGAALDVLTREPHTPDNPLITAPNCIVTPHVAWATREARQRLMAATAANIRAFLAGKPINIVNGEFLAEE